MVYYSTGYHSTDSFRTCTAHLRARRLTVRRVTLTFDNGPVPGVTELVLDTLAEYDARAIFFVVVDDLELEGARQLAQRAVAEGHWIGNHTMTHSVLLGESDDPTLPEREIGAAQRALGALAHPDRLFRPWANGGDIAHTRLLGPAAIRYLEAGGYTCLLWNSIPRDWERPDDWLETCLADVAARDWAVVVLHDNNTAAMRHLPAFLRELQRTGVVPTQELPDSCVPIRRGVRHPAFEQVLRSAAGGET
jgi:peptidoglycan/xylan/chitin deacetylase (PgdA/CDA1 family)